MPGMRKSHGAPVTSMFHNVVDSIPRCGVMSTTVEGEHQNTARVAANTQRGTMSFGDLVKDLRIAQKKTLRQFCLDHGHDPSNWSKLERGINPPPRDEKTLERWAKQLGLKPGPPQWHEFMDLADVARGEIPKHVLTDEELLKKLPVFFRSIRGAELTEKQLDELIRMVKELHTPDEDSSSVPKRRRNMGGR